METSLFDAHYFWECKKLINEKYLLYTIFEDAFSNGTT